MIAQVSSTLSLPKVYPPIYQLMGRDNLIEVIGCILKTVFCAPYDTHPLKASCVTVFLSSQVPNINIKLFVRNIAVKSRCSDEALILAVMSISWLHFGRASTMKVDSFVIHRLFITAVLVNAKFYDEPYCNNKFFASIVGMSVQEINRMELEFLKRMDFDLHIAPKIFKKFANILYDSSNHPRCNCRRNFSKEC